MTRAEITHEFMAVEKRMPFGARLELIRLAIEKLRHAKDSGTVVAMRRKR